MQNTDYEAFNKGLYLRISHTEKWEKGTLDVIESFLMENSPFPSERKNELPQFIFNVKEGKNSTTLLYPQKFIVTEIDLPTAIKSEVKSNLLLKKHWQRKFKSWYRTLKKGDCPYWSMYITPSGMGLRFIFESEVTIVNKEEYTEACMQFLRLLEPYGINSDYHDLTTPNRGWYFPCDKGYFDIKGDRFLPDLKIIAQNEENKSNRKVNGADKDSVIKIESLITAIKEKQIDITSNYSDWINIGFAIANTFGQEGLIYYQEISKFHPDYDYEVCESKYYSLLKSDGKGITLGTLFHIASKYGLRFSAKAKVDKFWYVQDGKTYINYNAYFNILYNNGIGRLITKHSDYNTFIKVDRNSKTVRQIEKFEISSYTNQLIDKLEIDPSEKERVANAFLGDSKILMTKNYAAIKPIKLDFIQDDQNTMYFYFQNCFVKVEKDAIATYDYNDLKGYIWESQIIPFEFAIENQSRIRKSSEFLSFIKDVSSDMIHEYNPKRYKSLRTVIGYLLHTYKDPIIPKSIVFTDASLSKDSKGRTGKGIVKNALGKMRKVASEDGKSFSFRSPFSYSQVSLDTDIFFLDDVTSNFDFEKLFSVLAEGIVIERKYKDKFFLSYEDSPKVLLTTNYAIQGSGDSFEGRIYEYEFSDYYKYGRSPLDKFGHRLFDNWDGDQWNLFYNFMIGCGQKYLKFGLVESPFINLKLKKVIAKTSFAFTDYLKENIELNKKYNKADIFDDLCKEHPSHSSWGQRTFTINLREYYKLQKCDVLESRSGKDRYFTIVRVSDDLS